MTKFIDRLRNGIADCELTQSRILLAVSGGCDSVAMLRGCVELQLECQLELVVGHLNHDLRGQQATDDAAWVSEICNRLGVPAILGRQDVAAEAKLSGQGLEETARQVRYTFLQATARQQSCSVIAVAHTADDQAETILHHIVRGTGISGLRGMPRTRRLESGVKLVRPLLDVPRHQIEEYLAKLKQTFRDDATNADETFTRNRIRRQLLPSLQSDFNPQVKDALCRLGSQAADVEQTLQALAAGLLETAIEDRGDNIVRLNCQPMQSQPRHLIRETMNCLWRQLNWPRQRMGFDEWDRLAELVLAESADEHCMPTLPNKIEARRRGNLLILRRL